MNISKIVKFYHTLSHMATTFWIHEFYLVSLSVLILSVLFIFCQALIPLANEGSEQGRTIAAHALAKISITQNPEIAFPGQRVGHIDLPFTVVNMCPLIKYTKHFSVLSDGGERVTLF